MNILGKSLCRLLPNFAIIVKFTSPCGNFDIHNIHDIEWEWWLSLSQHPYTAVSIILYIFYRVYLCLIFELNYVGVTRILCVHKILFVSIYRMLSTYWAYLSSLDNLRFLFLKMQFYFVNRLILLIIVVI